MIILREFIIDNGDGTFRGYLRIYQEEVDNDIITSSRIIGVRTLTPSDLDHIDSVVRRTVQYLAATGFGWGTIWWDRR